MTHNAQTNMDDLIDVRDVIARFEELEGERENAAGGAEDGKEADALATWDGTEDAAEYRMLKALLDDLKGYGGDENWRGDWYPITLIRDSHFERYAEELAEDCGMIQAGATWPNNCIDWEEAARQLKMDYSTVEFDGVTYWYR
jgi:hypothetical protein